ncbi:MAG TPA: helix-turn-helix domain-containing protein [Flavobacterium sp.]|nr:helix-turn-helix domain-containing protein [Flavobacterium sp.]
MSIFSDNLRHLRLGRSFSQQKLANDLIITRERLAKYEEGRSEPPFEILRRIALFFNISIDLLLSVDIRKVEIDRLLKTADNRILLPITVDTSGNDTIEIIPYRARAGYTTGYADPEFIENLQRISLPFLTNGKFRAFPVEGDSMPPHREGSFIIGKYVENLGDVRDGKTYIVLTRNDGIVYKRLNRNGKNSLMLHSDNAVYRPYEIKASEILEIWEFACSLSTKEAEPEDLSNENIRDILQELRKDIRRLKEN